MFNIVPSRISTRDKLGLGPNLLQTQSKPCLPGTHWSRELLASLPGNVGKRLVYLWNHCLVQPHFRSMLLSTSVPHCICLAVGGGDCLNKYLPTAYWVRDTGRVWSSDLTQQIPIQHLVQTWKIWVLFHLWQGKALEWLNKQHIFSKTKKVFQGIFNGKW